jgi:hypothetical protein
MWNYIENKSIFFPASAFLYSASDLSALLTAAIYFQFGVIFFKKSLKPNKQYEV